MKITLFLTSLWLAVASFLPAEKTAISGKISGANGQVLSGASIKVLKNRGLIASGVSDSNGLYHLETEPGIYDVECAYAGYVTIRLTGVDIKANEENTLHFNMDKSPELDEVVVRGSGTPAASYSGSAGETGGILTSDIKSVAAEKTDKKGSEASSAKGRAKRTERARKDDTVSKSGMAKTKSADSARPAPGAEPHAVSPAYDEIMIDGEMKKVRIVFEPETYEEKIEIVDDKGVAAPPGDPVQPAPHAGLLTAGEWSDLHNWNRHWTDLLADGEIDAYENMYGFFPKQRYTVMLNNAQDFPIADALVQLKSNGETVWEARTDNTGKAELWVDMFNAAPYVSPKGEGRLINAEAWINGEKHDLGQPKPATDGINRFKIEADCNAPKNVDIVWTVDATGSMGDELEYLKTELLDVIGRAKGRNPDLSFRMGTVFYRDVSDTYITKSSGLSYDISKTVDFIRKQSADGGGDYPEAVHSALEEAIYGQKWSEHAIARICFLVLDASPHQSAEVNASLQKSIREAARLGIRIVPVTASGIQKDTEFLMKFFGLATNGTYVFLTDHSGIGGKHLEPTTDEYKVEPLNELLVRLITEYTSIETCEGKSNIRFGPGQQQGQAWQALYYPNPASSQFVLELPVDVQSVTLYDSEGKAVRKLEKLQAGRNTVIVSDLPEGFYTIRILKDGQMQSGKLMVIRI